MRSTTRYTPTAWRPRRGTPARTSTPWPAPATTSRGHLVRRDDHVGGGLIDSKIYAYSLATKARDSGKDFDTLAGAGNNNPRGIWSDGTTMWVADRGDAQDIRLQHPGGHRNVTPGAGQPPARVMTRRSLSRRRRRLSRRSASPARTAGTAEAVPDGSTSVRPLRTAGAAAAPR